MVSRDDEDSLLDDMNIGQEIEEEMELMVGMRITICQCMPTI